MFKGVFDAACRPIQDRVVATGCSLVRGSGASARRRGSSARRGGLGTLWFWRFVYRKAVLVSR